jgi:dCTP deaminase
MENNDNIVRSLLFELIERIVRFYQHLDKVQDQFFTGLFKTEHKILFISSYKECLIKLLEIGIGSEKNKSFSQTKKIEIINECIIKLKNLHKNNLGHLPRPSEPNELRRFSRIINKQIEKFEIAEENSKLSKKLKLPNREISIYMTEEFGEETFNGDPLLQFKKESINGFIAKEKLNIQTINIEDQNITNLFHINIPRIDTFNACKWPTLLHELGHHLGKKEYFGNTKIENQFRESLNSLHEQFINDISQIIDLENWLKECWCDLFAATTMGPALWFSQFSSFIFNGIYELRYDQNGKYPYPFPSFRLKLIKRILSHRLKNTLVPSCREIMLDAQLLIHSLDHNFEDDRWKKLFNLFEKYFLQYFFTKDKTSIYLGVDQFNGQIEPLLKYTKEINSNIIEELIIDLKKKLPIPTKRLNKNQVFEHHNSIQEILLSAWIYRNTELKKEIFNILNNKNKIALDKLFTEYILKEFSHFDNNILKSIQVTEWVTLFSENLDQESRIKFVDEIENFINKFNKKKSITKSSQNQLVDFEIYTMIKKNKLRIIPLIDPKQIGTTSIDIRLGTSFQYYFPNQVGILDYTNQKTIDNTEINTKTIDLDFLDSITISPNQFILGHSMEFILLPDNLSAELDGRSSFARSGLQIHMTAGFIEPGFVGVLTYEIYNAGPNSIRLFPGMRIGQLRLIPVVNPTTPYSKKKDAKYKGLLSYNRGLQAKDDEVKILKKAVELMKEKDRI